MLQMTLCALQAFDVLILCEDNGSEERQGGSSESKVLSLSLALGFLTQGQEACKDQML